jgi:5-methylcytosine-specific restriction enzyme subunit McrC
MDDLKVTPATFNRIILDRKTEAYRRALEVAKLLLLNFHPDLSKGRNHVLALMFDMNLLWERFVYVSLRKVLPSHIPALTVASQITRPFWKHEKGNRIGIRPDIVIIEKDKKPIVVDTKWKNLTQLRPSDDDLKQMFVYHEYFKASRVALIYPGSFENVRGNYFEVSGKEGNRECSLIGLNVEKDIRKWQREIGGAIAAWLSDGQGA